MRPQTFPEVGIEIPPGRSGEMDVVCPQCSATRKKSRDKCLSVNTVDGTWCCHHCGWSGALRKSSAPYDVPKPKRVYVAPKPPAVEPLPERVVTWFARRGIPESILSDAGITAGREFSPSQRKEVVAIRFPYVRNGELVNIKYRAHPKDFWMSKDAERILYGVDDIARAETICIVEGEMDKLTIDTVHGPACVSVPDGAPAPDAKNYASKFSFLEGVAEERLKAATRVILATDMDDPGQKLADELARRIGYAKCLRVTWPEGCKDANETLIKLGEAAVLDALANAQPCPAPGDEAPSGRKSQATDLVALARQGESDLFHDRAGKPYITFTNGTHRETWLLSGTSVRDWLSAQFFAAYGTAPSAQALKDALNTLSGIARFAGECRPIQVRLAGHDGDIYFDLGNEAWEVVHISPAGWKIIPAAACPVRFRRPTGLLSLPHPTRGGDLSALQKLINVKSKKDVVLIIAWLLGSLRPDGPYTILCLIGEQGTAKTTLARMLRSLIDPNILLLRAEPRDEGDLLIAATNGLVVGFDNLSHLSPWLSDALCRLVTGGGLSKRQLYTDAEEVLLDAQRPVLLTGIEAVLTRGDAIDRAIVIELARIQDAERRTEEEIDADFAALRPGALGCLLDAASTALRNWPTTAPARLPRMADFARWGEAGAPAFGWRPNYFLDTYTGNRDEADEIAVEALPVGAAVRTFMDSTDEWEGVPTALLMLLTDQAGETARDRTWPKKAHILSGQLKRLAPHLRRLGIEVELGKRGTDGRRLIKLFNHTGKDHAKECQERQERQAAGDDADPVEVQQRQAASRPETTASKTGGENHRNGAENRHLGDALDALDAVSGPLQHRERDPWAGARRERL